MSLPDICHQFVQDLRHTGWWEFIAVIAGILSVWFSRSENILVYPTGLVNTIIYIYLSLKMSLLGEASVNLYYTVLNIYGWVMWIATNCASIPLYFVKHYVFTSIYYLVLLIIAIAGLLEWSKRAKAIEHAA